MRRIVRLVLLCSLVALAACGDATGPERRSVLGRWISVGFAPATVEMTLSELARSITGSGRWVAADTALAFLVQGTHAEGSVSLVFQLEGRPDLNFLGEFQDARTLEGTLVGGGFRGQSIVFRRVEEEQ